MDTLLLAFSTVFPMLAYMLIGMGIKRLSWLSERSLKELNGLVFKVLLPASIFNNIYKSEFGNINPGPVLLYAVLALLAVTAIAWAFYARTEPLRRRRSVLIQNAFRSNFVLFGLPLSQLLMQGRTSNGITEILIAVIVPIFNILSVFVLQYYGEEKADFKSVLTGIAKNPLIIAAVAGLLFKATGLSLPKPVTVPLGGLAGAATPLALIVLGGQFSFKRSRAFVPQLIMGVSHRLLITPALALGGAVLLGFRGEVLIAYLSMFASPVAVASYTMSQQMNADHELAGQLLVYTSLLSSVTLFFIIALFTHFAWI